MILKSGRNKMSDDLELTIAKETHKMKTCTPIEKKLQTRKSQIIFAVIVDENSIFDCVITAADKKDFKLQMDRMDELYKENNKRYSIVSIIKGHEVEFKETKAIEFL
jgi:hypothetical protein